MKLGELVLAILTEDDDDKIPDPLRVAFALTFIAVWTAIPTFMGLTIFDVVGRGKPFDMANFGQGVAALLTGISALILGTGTALWASSKQQPPAPGTTTVSKTENRTVVVDQLPKET